MGASGGGGPRGAPGAPWAPQGPPEAPRGPPRPGEASPPTLEKVAPATSGRPAPPGPSGGLLRPPAACRLACGSLRRPAEACGGLRRPPEACGSLQRLVEASSLGCSGDTPARLLTLTPPRPPRPAPACPALACLALPGPARPWPGLAVPGCAWLAWPCVAGHGREGSWQVGAGPKIFGTQFGAFNAEPQNVWYSVWVV